MRLAVFVDQVFWRDGHDLSTDESYVLFLQSLAGEVSGVTLIGRLAPEPRRAPYPVDSDTFSLLPLPYYPDLHRLWRADPRIYGRVRREVRAQAHNWDALLVSGPHPLGQMIARECIALGVPVVLVVRQNLVQQMAAHRGLKRWAALAAAAVLEWDFRRLARGRTVLAVGAEMADDYGRVARQVTNHFACLVDRARFEMFSKMATGGDSTRLICVSRLSPEKGHAHLLSALARLTARGVEYHLDIVGTGQMEPILRAQADRLGLGSRVTFHGYVPYGPALFDLYRRAGALVLPSITEGFPQVINEALSLGLPVVATRVGGIPSFLEHEVTALLLPPRDLPALADAIERIVTEDALRQRLSRNGRALMHDNTLEANRARVLEALHDEIRPRP
ncbi:glycosyltransferase family 4 protein [Methylorubrum extorquens]|uniref:glycosyltransferase family 4 protein n=1 Tax=Methylorubrum extorquens TaxID=408 RepID=UPI0020A1F076|nr:glycosyltransferase family 4 protein [Methylorubrum extorquens]MCP1538831.1 glycosyltransferase involved in cell wall biosynthesis [Methylorubrum extorquens]